MEIERKFLVNKVPENLEQFPCRIIEQGYLNRAPVVRIRRDDDRFVLTCKSEGLMVREEYEMELDASSYDHLKEKADGNMIQKRRYMIPCGAYTVELDVFGGVLAPLVLAEVEFPGEEEARSFTPPGWFGEEVTFSGKYHNSYLSTVERFDELCGD